MYKSSRKLPQWQRYPSPTYRRTCITRRKRVFFIIGICLVAWYHYLTPSLPILKETHLDKAIPASRPKWKTNIVSYPESLYKGHRERDNGDEEDIINLSKSGVSPEYSEDESSPKERISTSPQSGSPEYADDDAAPRNALKQGLRDSDAAEGHGVLETIDQKPPQLVKQAYERLVEQHLTPAPKYEGEKSTPNPKSDGPRRFPPYAEYAMLDEKAEALPDIVHIPFEVSTADVVLEGWEDEWFADAKLNVAKWGKIEEPKIDFVYTCKKRELLLWENTY